MFGGFPLEDDIEYRPTRTRPASDATARQLADLTHQQTEQDTES